MMITQIEAKEACDWLRAAGFPQYAQLFEDQQFPVDIETVKNDHEFLDRDAFESLCRRLNALNKCATMKVEISRHRKRSDESEEDEPCAISNKWAYERHSQRWSRLEDLNGFPLEESSSISFPDSPRFKSIDQEDISFCREKHDVSSLHSSSSGDSYSANYPKTFEDLETSRSSSRCSSSKLASPDSTFSCSPSPSDTLNIISEDKLFDKPPNKKGKSLLRKMEKLRLKSSSVKRGSHLKGKLTISGPVLLEGLDEDKLKNLNCVNISDLTDGQSKRHFSYSPQTCSSSSPSENSSTVSTPSPIIRVRSHAKRSGIYAEDFDPTKLSIWNDVSEQNLKNKINLHENQMFEIPHGHKPGTFPKALTDSILSPIDNTSVNWRTGSFHGCRRNRMRLGSNKDSEAPPSPLSLLDNRLSIYDNVPNIPVHFNAMESTGEDGGGDDDEDEENDNDNEDDDDDDVFSELDNVMEHVNGLRKLVNQWTEKFSDDGDSDFANDSTSPCPSSPRNIHLKIKRHSEGQCRRTPVRETDNTCGHDNDVDSTPLPFITISGTELTQTHSSRLSRPGWTDEQYPRMENLESQIDSQSAAQLNRIQRLALLKLTALMDKYSPSSKQGWNWTVPKFIRKIKAPDYKDKYVFGVPFLLNVQRTGHPIPKGILRAMEYLRIHFLDQVGLFRKSGVKSRIQSLREMNEIDPNGVSYEGQSAFDVADMVKQYFRDLPEPIFTTKLCESFLHIYQYIPKDQQFYAVQAAILLLPDENREALMTLLVFLRDVVACVEENQMTPTNIAVCLAPSLFHLNTLRRESSSSSRSSQRKYSLGKPDQRDLSENLAATHGLAHMIAECSRLFQIPGYCLDQCYNSLNNQKNQCEAVPAANPLAAYSSILISLENSMQSLLRDAKEKFRSWTTCSSFDHVELAYKKVEDDNYPARLWKSATEIEASPKEILQHILRQQRMWDPSLQQEKIVETLDDDTEIYQYSTESMAPLPPRDYVVLRTWRTDPNSGTCVLAATSIESEGATTSGILGQVILCKHLIENIGPQKSKLTHVCRIDTRGRTTEWYNRVFGHMCASEIIRIKNSFKSLHSEIKETKI